MASEPTTVPADAPEPPPGRGPALRTLLAGVLLVAGLLVVGAAVVLLTRPETAPQDDVTVVVTPVPLASRVPPTRQAPLPEMRLEGFDGGAPVALSSYRGAPMVVNFWATWCAPCVEEMPHFVALAHDYRGRVDVLGVNVRDAPANAEAFARELGIDYDLASDPDGDLFFAVDGFGMPTTLFVNADGTIVYRHTGLLDAGQLRRLVEEHLLG